MGTRPGGVYMYIYMHLSIENILMKTRVHHCVHAHAYQFIHMYIYLHVYMYI